MKHALIVGGSKGTGKVIANMFSSKGYNVSVLARSQPEDVDVSGFSKNILYRTIDFENYTNERVGTEMDHIRSKNGPINYIVFCQRFRGKDDSWKNELNISL